VSAVEVILTVAASVVLGGGIMFGGWVLVTDVRWHGPGKDDARSRYLQTVCGGSMVGLGGYLVLSGLLWAVTA